MAGFQEEDFSWAFDSDRDVHADWLRESNKVMVLSGIVWVRELQKVAFSFVFIQSLVLESFYIALYGILICLKWYCHVHQGTINMNDADVQSE